jgi:hypothetical protein
MRIIAFETCRVTALFPFEEVTPLGGVSDLDIVEKIKARYAFAKAPDLATAEVSKNGYKFETGKFSFESTPARIADFAVYRDGIVINASKTNVAEAFLDDVISFMQKEFSFREFMTPPRRYFQSQIVVEFDRTPEKLINSLNAIASAVSEPLVAIYGVKIPMKFARLDFDADKENLSFPAPATVHKFIIERRLNIPFAKERFFCSAPMRTDTHVAVLEKIETLME